MTSVDSNDHNQEGVSTNFQADRTYKHSKINYGAGEIVPESEGPQNPYGQHFVGQYTPPDGKKVKPTTAAGTSLDRLVRDIKDKVNTAKDLWIQLPYLVCNEEKIAAQPDKDDQCWNGQDRAKYVLDNGGIENVVIFVSCLCIVLTCV